MYFWMNPRYSSYAAVSLSMMLLRKGLICNVYR